MVTNSIQIPVFRITTKTNNLFLIQMPMLSKKFQPNLCSIFFLFILHSNKLVFDSKNKNITSSFLALFDTCINQRLFCLYSQLDGPRLTAIRGPSVLKAGVPTNYICSSNCNPSCYYTWRAGGHVVVSPVVWVTWSGHHELLKLECTATHPVTMRSEKVSKIVTIDSEYQK